jgi:hypothetical protein
MDKATLFEEVHVDTRRLGEGVVNMERIYVNALQRVCAAARFEWRKKWVTFSTVAGTATYNLHSTSVVSGATEEVDEIIGLYRIDSATEQPKLIPVFDPDEMVAIQHSTDSGEPTKWLLEPGTDATVHLWKKPNSVQTIRVLIWAIPNPSEDTLTIPLLPSRYHRVLQKVMEADVWRKLPGEGVESPNYVKAARDAEYDLAQMVEKVNFSTQKERTFARSGAVVSTR